MDQVFIPAVAALAGSALGALSGIATTWLTLHAQERGRGLSQALARRETLYGEFIDEASKLLTDAVGHKLDDAAKFVGIYALISKLRLFTSESVIRAADNVMTRIIETYAAPVIELSEVVEREQSMRDFDILRRFSEVCRHDLDSFSQLPLGPYVSTNEATLLDME
jgi:hypothetical protein